jgi:hypothetical protein
MEELNFKLEDLKARKVCVIYLKNGVSNWKPLINFKVLIADIYELKFSNVH